MPKVNPVNGLFRSTRRSAAAMTRPYERIVELRRVHGDARRSSTRPANAAERRRREIESVGCPKQQPLRKQPILVKKKPSAIEGAHASATEKKGQLLLPEIDDRAGERRG